MNDGTDVLMFVSFVLGILLGCIIMDLFVKSTYDNLTDVCAKENNVFMCKTIAVPVTDEGEIQ